MADLGKRALATFAAIAALAAGIAIHPAPFVQRVEGVVERVTGRVAARVSGRVARPAPAGAQPAPATAVAAPKDAGSASGFTPTLPGCDAAPVATPKPSSTPGAPPDFVTMGSCGDATAKAPAKPAHRDPKKPGGE